MCKQQRHCKSPMGMRWMQAAAYVFSSSSSIGASCLRACGTSHESLCNLAPDNAPCLRPLTQRQCVLAAAVTTSAHLLHRRGPKKFHCSAASCLTSGPSGAEVNLLQILISSKKVLWSASSNSTGVCRPGMLFQHQPYIDQEPLHLNQREIGAVVDAVCGTAGSASAWGVCLATLPCSFLCGLHLLLKLIYLT